MKTVADRWKLFDKHVLSKTAPDIQRKEMRRAFYAGFYDALVAGLEMADESGDDDDAGASMMRKLYEECTAFAGDVAAGKA
jgi:hypothetical protein